MKVLDLPLLGNLDDLAQGVGTLGSDLVTNGDFANWTGDDPDDWTVENEDGNNYVTEDSGKANLVSDNSAVLYMWQDISISSAGLYQLLFDISINTQGWRMQIIDVGGGPGGGNINLLDPINFTNEGTIEQIYYCQGTAIRLIFYRYLGASSDYTVDNVSVKGFTPTGAMDRESAGTYINRLGLLKTAWGNRTQLINITAQEDLTTWWSLTRAANSTAGSIVADTNNATHYASRLNLMSADNTYVLSIKAKPGAKNFVRLAIRDDDATYHTYFDLSSGAVSATDTADYSGISGPDSEGYYRCYIVQSVNTVSSNNEVFIFVSEADNDSTFAGDDASVSAYVKEIMLEALPSGNVLGDDLFDQETLGSELVTNGDFETGDPPSSWIAQGTNTTEASADVPTGGGSQSIKVTRVDSNWAVAQALSLTAGKTYKITFWAKLGTADSLGYVLDGISQVSILKPATWTQYTFYYNYTGKSSTFYLALVNAGTAWFDNVSIKEVTGAARGMPAAEVLGPELCPSPDCSTDFWDSKDANWTHDAVNDEFDSDGSQGSNADMREDGVVAVGQVYKVVWTIANRSAGSAWVSCGNTGVGATRNANGTYTEYIKAAGNTSFYVWGDSSFVGSVSAISIKLVSKGGLWPALAGAEAITAQNDRDFSSGTIGNWAVNKSGSGTLTYDTTDIGGADDKQALLTSSGDTYLYAGLIQTYSGITANTLFRAKANIYVPAANTLKNVIIRPGTDLSGAIYSNSGETLTGDTWTEVICYIWIAADAVGTILIGFNGNPADGDLLYFDDISIRPVQFSWTPLGTDTIEIDETEDALKVTYVDNTAGAQLTFADASDLSSNLTVGETYLLQFDAKQGAVGAVSVVLDITGTDQTITLTTAWVTYKLVFVAGHASTDLIRFANMGAGEIAYIRNLSIKAVPDLALLEPSDYVNSATIPARARFESQGILLEGEAKNICLYSEDLSQWSRVRVKASYGSVIDPRGITNVLCGITADETSTAVKYTLKYIQAEQVLDNTVHCFSVFLKAGTKEWAQLWIEGKDDAGHACSFRLVGDGTVGTEVSVDGNAGMVAIGNGWYRCWVSSNLDSGAVPPSVRIYGLEGDNDQAVDTTDGDVMAYSYGAQLEQGSFPTSYIPTTTCPVTRLSEAADAANNGVSWDMLSQLTDQLVEELGAELVSNNDFATDTVWIKGTGWTISGGVAVGTATSGMIYQGVDLADGELYRCEVEIVSRTAGNLTFYVNGEASETFDTVGVHVMYIYAGTANTNLGVNANGFTGTIDNVYFKKVTRQSKGTLLLDWTPRYSETEGTGTVGIVACRDGAASLFYTGHGDSVGAYDQVTAAVSALTWVRNNTYQAAIRFGFLDQDLQKFEVGISAPEILGSDLVANGGFEAWTGGDPDNWSEEPEITTTEYTDDPQAGSKSVKVSLSGAANKRFWQTIVTEATTLYKLEFYYKVDPGSQMHVRNDDAGSYIFSNLAATGWEKMTGYFTSVDTDSPISFRPVIDGDVIYLDSVTIKKVTQSSTWAWGTAQIYDGSFLLGSKLRLSYDNIFPQNIRNLKIYDTVYSQAQIEAGGLDGKQIPRKWFFGNWRQR